MAVVLLNAKWHIDAGDQPGVLGGTRRGMGINYSSRRLRMCPMPDSYIWAPAVDPNAGQVVSIDAESRSIGRGRLLTDDTGGGHTRLNIDTHCDFG